ncbi:MAG: Y-family DNA polymerase [Candidatus Saccharimonadales bacterium]
MIALVDCNNFFVSCERVFDPGLVSRPVAVLSSNDGCIVARSNEVKDLGVTMGAPAFKYKELLVRHRVVLKSSNFALYSDMSRRVMATLREYTPEVEIYSVDEAFLPLAGEQGYLEWAQELRDKVGRDTGIPVSVGVASTRTLAKAAATLSKRRSGVLSFADLSESEVDDYLRDLPVGDVWGIGRKLNRTLQAYQVRTAYGLRELPEGVLSQLSVSVRRTVQELRGEAAAAHKAARPKSMVSTRSFSSPIVELAEVREALSSHAATLAAKLRREDMTTRTLSAFIATGAYEGYRKASLNLAIPTSSTSELVRAAGELAEQVYRSGLRYKKAGVMAYELVPIEARQLALDSALDEIKAGEKIDSALDTINRRWGPHALQVAAEGWNQSWQPRHALRSPRYTTEWDELKLVG